MLNHDEKDEIIRTLQAHIALQNQIIEKSVDRAEMAAKMAEQTATHAVYEAHFRKTIADLRAKYEPESSAPHSGRDIRDLMSKIKVKQG